MTWQPPPNNPYAIDPVVELLGGGRVVGYRVALGHACKSLAAGVLLSQFWYWQNLETSRVRDGWFYAQQPEITEATAMTRTEIETARQKLVNLNVLAEERREGNRLWFRINKDVLYRLLLAHAQGRPGAAKAGQAPPAPPPPADRNAWTMQTGMHGPCKPECMDHANSTYRDFF